MDRYYGNVGYAVSGEDPLRPGIYIDTIIVKPYYGDIIKTASRWQGNSQSPNDDTIINNTISIIADQFAYQNFSAIKYAEYLNQKWKVSSIEVQSPRLILTLGGVYNG